MPLQPIAKVNAKMDRTRTKWGDLTEYELVAGTNIVEEGMWMIAGGAGSVQQVTTSAGADQELPMGVAWEGKIEALTFTEFESGTVPAAPGPYTFQLNHASMVANTYSGFADAFVWDTTGATELEVAGAAVAATSVTLGAATGIITFAAADAGHAFFVRYRYNLTAAESRELMKSSPVGRDSGDTFDKVMVMHGHATVYTTMFDCDAAWALNVQDYGDPTSSTPLATAPVLGAGGVLTVRGNNNNGTHIGTVVELPSATSPFLGVEYDTSIVIM